MSTPRQTASNLLTAFTALLTRHLPREAAERLQAGGTPTAADIAAAAEAGRAVLARQPRMVAPLAALFVADRAAFNEQVRTGLRGILASGRYPGSSPRSGAHRPAAVPPSDMTFSQAEADRYANDGGAAR